MPDPTARDAHEPTSTVGASSAFRDEVLERRWSAIAAKLHQARFWLTDQGGLVARRDDGGAPRWVVRFVVAEGNRRRHRSIGIGSDPELVRRAQAMLDAFRSEKEFLKTLPRLTAMLEASTRGQPRRRRRTTIGRPRTRGEH